MNPRSAIAKGKQLENHVAKRLNELGIDINANRQIGSGSGLKKGDIQTSIGITFECKNTKTFKWKEAQKQVQRESMGYQQECIIWHSPNTPLENSIAIIPLEDYLQLLKIKKDNLNRTEILDKYTIKSNLERATHHLKQVIKEL